jgi:hypothetical protein
MRLMMKPLLSPWQTAQKRPREVPNASMTRIVSADVWALPISSTIARFQDSVKKCRLTSRDGSETASAICEQGMDELLVARRAVGFAALMSAKTRRFVCLQVLAHGFDDEVDVPHGVRESVRDRHAGDDGIEIPVEGAGGDRWLQHRPEAREGALGGAGDGVVEDDISAAGGGHDGDLGAKGAGADDGDAADGLIR